METDIAWAAGFLDGEGCFSLTAVPGKNIHKTTRSAALSVAQKRRAPLDKLADLFGGNVHPMNHGDGKYSGWQWSLQGEKLVPVARAVLPYLVLKTREAEIVLAYAETVKRRGRVSIPKDIIQLRGLLIEEMKAERGGGS